MRKKKTTLVPQNALFVTILVLAFSNLLFLHYTNKLSSENEQLIQLEKLHETKQIGVESRTDTNTTTESKRMFLHLQEQIEKLQENMLTLKEERTNNNKKAASSSTTSSTLPSCQDLMNSSSSSSPYSDGSFLTRSTIPISWHPRVDDSRQLHHSMCELHRYTARQARQCLKGKHLYMPGDSISRYLYLSLTTFLHHGVYPPRFGIVKKKTKNTTTTANTCTHRNQDGVPQCSLDDEPNICISTDWRDFNDTSSLGWNAYLRAIGSTLFDGYMEGNTFILGMGSRVENYWYEKDGIRLSFTSETGYTNGQYYGPTITTSGKNNEKEATTAINNNNDNNNKPNPLRGYYFTNCSATGSCNMTTQKQDEFIRRASNHSYDFEEAFVDAIGRNGTLRNKVFSRTPVDIIIYNRGLWGVLNDYDTVKQITHNMYDVTTKGTKRSIASSSGQSCFFRSTTGNFEQTLETERSMVKPLVHEAGCGYIDFAHVLQDFNSLKVVWPKQLQKERDSIYTDPNHFQPWVYEELNNLLLNILCNTAD